MSSPNAIPMRAVGGLLVAAGGLLLLLRHAGWAIDGRSWPLVIIVPGLATFAIGAVLGRRLRILAIGGAVVLATGLVLFGQELTDYYQSWAYLWPLLPGFAGLAMLLTGGDAAAKRIGLSLLASSAVLLVLFASLFEGMIFHGDFLVGTIVLPIVLILAGAALFIRSATGMPSKEEDRAAKAAGPGRDSGNGS